MSAKLSPSEIRTTVNGGEFYTFACLIAQQLKEHQAQEVVLSVRENELIMEAAPSGCAMQCSPAPAVTARLQPESFYALLHLVRATQGGRPLQIVFRPELGEIGVPYTCTQASFDRPARS